MLIAGERPAIIVGQGVRHGGAAAELLQLAGRLQIPVGASARRARRDRLPSSAVAWPRVARRALPGERRDAPRVRLCTPTASPMTTTITPQPPLRIDPKLYHERGRQRRRRRF
jgi:hypothetical protein